MSALEERDCNTCGGDYGQPCCTAWRNRAEQAEAENERLRVCGTCGSHDGHWNGCINKGWPRGDRDDDGLFGDNDACHFTPPRWTPYWEEP